MAKFAGHLHVHSRVSVKDGLPSPEKLIDHARKMGLRALALTDHGTMGGHYMFAKEASKKADDKGNPLPPIKPIFGVEAYICDDITFKQFVTVTDEEGNKRRKAPKNSHIVLLAKNEEGYGNMLRLSKIAAIEGYYRDPRIDWNALSENSRGIICTSACIGGEVGRAIKDGDSARARDIADRHRQLFGDDYYLEIQNHYTDDERRIYEGVCDIADDMGIKLIATNDVHYLKQSDADAHRILVSLRFGRDVKQGGSSDARDLDSAYKTPEFHMKDEADMVKAFGTWRPDALANIEEVVEKCEYSLPTTYPLVWPSFEFDENDPELREWRDRYVPEQSLIQAYLSREARRGLVAKGLHKDPVYAERLRYELNSIYDLGYEKYFLVQLQIVKRCEELGIMIGPGRGSGAGSLVLYCLGITKVDPIKYGLLFERFLNAGRGPQLDHTLPLPEFGG